MRPLKFINFGEEKSFIKKGSGDSSWNYKYSYVNDTSELFFNINEASEVSSNDVLLNIFDWYHFVIQKDGDYITQFINGCLLYTSPSPRDKRQSRMPSSA